VLDRATLRGKSGHFYTGANASRSLWQHPYYGGPRIDDAVRANAFDHEVLRKRTCI
jgi:hypothetical protein